MKSIIEKPNTLRTAVACCSVAAGEETIRRMQENNLPKKDVLIIARAAGVMAAKKTPDLIPYCHPLPVASVAIDYEVKTNRMDIRATVEAVWNTGVEMEALTAASVCALTIYDMLKPVDKNLVIQDIRLVSKKGGKTDYGEKVPPRMKAAVVVTSDGTAQGKREDRSGQIIRVRLEARNIETSYHILPDDKREIARLLETLCAQGVALILTTGGTGLGPRDVTVEATRAVIDREVPGIMEAIRSFGQQRTPYAMLSRGVAGQKGGSIIVNLPGSSKGAQESLAAVFPAILHAFAMIKGGGHGA